MRRIKLVIAYDGSGFFGFQKQPGLRTVESELTFALKQLHKGEDVAIVASGRTDTGVHAKGQVIHFDTHLHIPIDRWQRALSSFLPGDIAIVASEDVANDFHARFDAVQKQYRYRLQLSEQLDIFRRNFVYHVPLPLCVESMKEAAGKLIGTHDFTSFCSAKTEVESKVRTIERLDIVKEEDELLFIIEGDGFLYNQIRIIIGTLIEVGRKKRSPEEIANILAARDRTKAGPTVPGRGLYLWKVSY